MEPLTLLTAGTAIVKGIKAIAPFFGDKGAKVAEAVDTIDDAVSDIKNDRLPPEAKVQLANITMSRDVQMAAHEIQKMRLPYEDAAGGREVIKTALLSDDPLVRQARPRMMILMGQACIVFAFYAPLAVVAAGHCGFGDAVISNFMSVLIWVGGFLFGSFTTSFTGYTVARTADKKTMAGAEPGKLLGMAASIGRRIA